MLTDIRLVSLGNLPPPTTPEEVGARLLAQERFEVDGEVSITTLGVPTAQGKRRGGGVVSLPFQGKHREFEV